MSYILGIDTGGTYTDGVLVEAGSRDIADSAKSLTTREDLSIGIGECISQMPPELLKKVALVCLSTTLATNSVVEGRSGRVGLFLIGREVRQELPVQEMAVLRGKLDIKGRELIALDQQEIELAVEQMKGRVDAVAISGYASVRNPAHELAVKRCVRSRLKVPVVCAYELSQTLGFYERTVTAVLNAGLIPCIADLIRAVDDVLAGYGLAKVPVMLMKGDGSLMSREFAMDRPIETVLSGPAASIVGGQFLTGMKDALILDMGGTTTDIAELTDGRAALNESGATVGGWKTQLKAVNIYTFGCGGDSRIGLDRAGHIKVGPERVVPLSLAGSRWPYLEEELRKYILQANRELQTEQHDECYYFLKRPENIYLNRQEEKVLELLKDGAHSIFYLEEESGFPADELGLDELVRMGAVQRCGLTPTDLLHIAGDYTVWSRECAYLGVSTLAARKGIPFQQFFRKARNATEKNIMRSCLQMILGEFYEAELAEAFAECLQSLPDDRLLQIDYTVKKPIIALGAPVRAWLPEACEKMHAELVIPEHAEVANAVGAAVGSVSLEARALIRPDQYHEKMVVHAPWGNRPFSTLEEAREYALREAADYIRDKAEKAGGRSVEVTSRSEPVYTSQLGTEEKVFVEEQVTAIAVGAPEWS